MKSISLQNLEELCMVLVNGVDGSGGKLKEWYCHLGEEDEFFKYKNEAGEVKYRHKSPDLRVEDVTSHMVAAYLRAQDESGRSGHKHKHPAKSHPHLFSKSRAKAVVTYQWKQPLGGKHGLLRMIRDSGTSPDTELWIDVWFIDQNSREIVKELAISQEFYCLCQQHLVAATFDCCLVAATPECCNDDTDISDRAWCLWELSLRAYAQRRSQIMGKLKVRVSAFCCYNRSAKMPM